MKLISEQLSKFSMVTEGNLENSPNDSVLLHRLRDESVGYGSCLVPLLHFFGAAIIYVQSRHHAPVAAHGKMLAITGIVALCLRLPILDRVAPWFAATDDPRSSTRRLLVLAVLAYVGFLFGYAVNPSHVDLHPFILISIVYGGVCFSQSSFWTVYATMLASLLAVNWFASKQLHTFDYVYILAVTPILGTIVCRLQTTHYRNLFHLQNELREQKQELERVRTGLVHEQQRREEAEQKRREADDELQRQNDRFLHVGRVNAMGEMVAGIAHEINQPLNAISLHSGVLRHPNTATESRDTAAHEIQKLSNRCAKIIRRLQGFIRVNTGEESEINITQLIDESIALTASVAKTYNIEVAQRYRHTDVNVIADEVQIQQVLVNLLRNAFDSMQDQTHGEKRVTVSTEDDSNFLRVSIADRGCGLADDDISKLSEPFYTTKPNGMGMGLAICRSIVERYGGSLDAKRNGEQGMVFSFTIRKEKAVA